MTIADLPLLLLIIVAPIGAIDILYFHLWRFRLYDAPTARGEMITHVIRGVVFVTIAALLALGRPVGVWFWVVAALALFDFVNTLADVYLERDSRAPMGGLPRAEYMVHIIGETFAGGVAVAFLLTGWAGRLLPTALAPATRPTWLTWQAWALVVGGAAMVLAELSLFVRSIARSGWGRR